MKAVVVPRYGDPSVLEVRDLPEPVPGPGQLRVQVRAVGVNFADILARLGIYKAAPRPPFVPGLEVAGIVEQAGEKAGRLKAGDRVMAFCPFGGYAEKAVVAEDFVFPIPDDMSFPEAAAFPVQYLTAWYALHEAARVRKGETVLVHAAAGGVGIAALQLLRPLGARVFATVGSAQKAAVVKEENADAVPILYTEEDFAERIRRETGHGVDVVLDSIGGEVFRKSWNLLNPFGRHILFGAAAAVKPGAIARLGALWRLRAMLLVSPLVMLDRNRTLAAFNLYYMASQGDLLREAAARMMEMRSRGLLKPRVGLALPLEKAVEAQRRMQERRTVGKVVLTVG